MITPHSIDHSIHKRKEKTGSHFLSYLQSSDKKGESDSMVFGDRICRPKIRKEYISSYHETFYYKKMTQKKQGGFLPTIFEQEFELELEKDGRNLFMEKGKDSFSSFVFDLREEVLFLRKENKYLNRNFLKLKLSNHKLLSENDSLRSQNLILSKENFFLREERIAKEKRLESSFFYFEENFKKRSSYSKDGLQPIHLEDRIRFLEEERDQLESRIDDIKEEFLEKEEGYKKRLDELVLHFSFYERQYHCLLEKTAAKEEQCFISSSDEKIDSSKLNSHAIDQFFNKRLNKLT